jgi:3-mercaptopyruvate sulfurtransferase SseA
VAQRLREQGITKAYALRGGFAAWLAAGGPTEDKYEGRSTKDERSQKNDE